MRKCDSQDPHARRRLVLTDRFCPAFDRSQVVAVVKFSDVRLTFPNAVIDTAG